MTKKQIINNWRNSSESPQIKMLYHVKRLMWGMNCRQAKQFLEELVEINEKENPNFSKSTSIINEKIKSLIFENEDRLRFLSDGYNREGCGGEGFNRQGYDKRGCRRNGFDDEGYNRQGFHRNGFDREGHDQNGFDRQGYDRNGFRENGYNDAGYDRHGFDRKGYDKEGYDRNRFNRNGIDREGFNRSGFNGDGYDRSGFGRDGYHKTSGYNRQGYDRSGHDKDGYDKIGFNQAGYDQSGHDKDGYDKIGFNQAGYDQSGHDKGGYDKAGFNQAGYDQRGYQKNGFNDAGFDRYGCRRDGFNVEGYDRFGFDKNGFDKDGYGKDGYHKTTNLDREGYDRGGYDLEGYDWEGHNEKGYTREGKVSPSKWCKYFKPLINQVTQKPSHETAWSANQQYKDLTELDKELAFSWLNNEIDNDYAKAKMLSARAAEKVSTLFYQELGFNVEDTSIKQITNRCKEIGDNQDNDWKLYDLLLNNELCIDVKNARTTFNSNSSYFEHCVSKFKQNRQGDNITISGVLSGYHKLDDMLSLSDSVYDTQVTFLGETTFPYLKKLQDHLSNRFLELSISEKNFLPRWVFEFPDEFYSARDSARNKLRKSIQPQAPSLKNCQGKEINPLPAYLSSGIKLPEAWRRELNTWQINFYNRLLPAEGKKITMPVLFLAILTHFLESITTKKNIEEYIPTGYRQLLYESKSDEKNWGMPLGIHDPLGTISMLIKTLNILWSHKGKTNLEKFKLFKFNGIGLLQGKCSTADRYETILAYCGGSIKGYGKCGNNPLVLGEHETCPECGKLICEKCQFCAEERFCLLCKPRMGKFNTARGEYSSFNEPTLDPDEGLHF